MRFIMLEEYLKNNLYAVTKENKKAIAEELTNGVFSEWNEKLESFTHICDLYDYVFRFYDDGRIVMEDRILEDTNCEWRGENKCGHLEYSSIDQMLIDWLDEIKNTDTVKAILEDEIQFIEQLKQMSYPQIEEKTKGNDNSSQIIEDIKWFMFGEGDRKVENDFGFSHELQFVTWAGDGHCFIVKDADGNEYRIRVSKED